MSDDKKKIWIDLDNSPHIPFFNPIKKELNKRGYQVFLTVRDCFQVCGLADLYGLNYKRIGRHYGKNKILKVLGTLLRSLQLLTLILKEKPALAVSHGSRSQLITSTMLRIPSICIFDYEHTQGLVFIKPTWDIAPEIIANKLNIHRRKPVLKYPGLKEDVYVIQFAPDPEFRSGLGLSDGDIVVTIRPPATEAHYHNPEAEKLFVEVVNFIGSNPECKMVILPRNEITQKDFIQNTWSEWCETKKIVIPKHVVNGLDLIWASDLVVSGGGTMNREAAALGIPVYTIFRGKIGAIDQDLSDTGRLTLLKKVEDVRNKIKLIKRNKSDIFIPRNRKALEQVVDIIIEKVEGGRLKVNGDKTCATT